MNEAVKDAKAPWWKTLLYWLAGTLLAVGVVVGLVWVFKRKSPNAAVKAVIEDTKNKLNLVDIEAKLKVAEAVTEETKVVEDLKRVKAIEDRQARMDALAELL